MMDDKKVEIKQDSTKSKSSTKSKKRKSPFASLEDYEEQIETNLELEKSNNVSL